MFTPPEEKLIIEQFVSELKDQFGERILGVFLFGSRTKGEASPESDIDLLVVYSDINERELLEKASRISFEIVLKEGMLIETVPMSKEEYERSLGHSPFLWEVLKFGRPIFTTLSGTEWELDFRD